MKITGTCYALLVWDQAIERKLAMLESIYNQLVGRADAARFQTLEWIIIFADRHRGGDLCQQ